MLPESTVIITDQSGKISDLINTTEAGEDIQRFEGILSPGFVNTHCHLELSHMKGMISQQSGMVDFLLEVVRQRGADRDIVWAAIEKAEDQMIENGIVAVGDICNTNHTIDQKAKARLYYHNFIESTGFIPALATNRFQQAVGLHQEFAEKLPNNSIVPHAPYSVSALLLEKIIAFPSNRAMTMHNQESLAENDLYFNKTGDFLRLYDELKIDISFFTPANKTSLQSLMPYFKREQPIVLVHNVCTSEEDIAIAASYFESQALYYCLCPNANLYIGNGLPEVELLIKNKCNLVLGTDSLASNNQLNILDEINTLKKHFPSLSMNQLLQWATINGAKALSIDDVYGSFEKGKTPGIVWIKDDQAKRVV